MDRAAQALTRRPAWLVAGLVGMLCVALTSGVKPWVAAFVGAFLPADLAADVAAAQLFIQRTSPYGPVIRTVHMNLIGLPLHLTLPFFPHPPFSLVIGLPLGFLSFRAAAVLWFASTIALLLVLAVLLNRAMEKGGRPGVLPLWLLLLAWPPVLYNLEKGQWSVIVAVFLALAWQAVAAGNLLRAAVWGAIAASVKVFPAVLGVYFLMRSVRVTLWFVAIGAVLLMAPLAWIGPGSLAAFMHESRMNLPYWESFPLVMFSPHGAITRALVGGQFAEPFVHAPLAAKLIEWTLLSGLLGIALWTTLRAKRGSVEQSLAFLVWLALLPIVNPLSMGHNGVLLALPFAAVADRLQLSGRSWQRWTWAAALVLVSVPHQTVWRYATPPAGPLAGLAIAALPTWGALMLFLVAASVANTMRSAAPSAGPSDKISASPAAPGTFIRG